MNRPARWLAGIVGVLALLLVLAAGAIALLLDPARVRDELVAAVQAQTGRELRIEQPVELRYFPLLGASLRGVSLGNAPGFGDEPLARLDVLRVGVKVLPLVSGRLELGALILEGLEVNLVRDADGTENWRDLTGAAPAVTDADNASTAPRRKSEGGLAAFLLGGVELTRGRVSWRDERAGARYLVDDISLRTGAIAADLAVPVRFSGRVVQEESRRTVRLTGSGNLTVGERSTAVSIPDLVVAAKAEGEGLSADGLQLDARAGLRYDLAAQAMTLAPLAITGSGLRMTAEVRGGQLASEPTLEGAIELAEAKPRTLLALLGVAPVATTDPTVLGRAQGRLPFRIARQSATFDGLSLTLDDTALGGRLTVADLAAPALRFELTADGLDLDRYLPPRVTKPGQGEPTSAGVPPRPQAAGAVVAAGAALPTETLRRLDLEGELRVGSLKAGGARLSELRSHWRAQSGVITQAASAKLYGGNGQATSTLDARAAQPAMSLKGTLQGIDLQGLLADTTGGSRLSGKGTVEADLRWAGLAETEVKKTLNGSLRIALRDGAVRGFDLDGLVHNALAAIKGGQKASGSQQTDFSELSASATVRNGVLSNRDLKAISPLLRVSGEGSIDLPANRIDYLANATLVEGAQGRLGINVKELEGTAIPVRFTGSLDDPAIRLDVDEVLKDTARHQIERKVEEKLKGEWGDKLKKFFGR